MPEEKQQQPEPQQQQKIKTTTTEATTRTREWRSMKMSGEHWVREVLKTRVTENFRDGGAGYPPFPLTFFR